MGADDRGIGRPPSLREVLDAGCDLTEVNVNLEALAETAFAEVPFMALDERARRAAANRAHVEDLLNHYGGPLGRALLRGVPPAFQEVQELATGWAWAAELFDDPGLAERFREALPEPLVSTYRRHFDEHRRPHPIEVRMPPGHWRCNCCGAAYDEGEAHAVTVSDRENFSDLDYPIDYCADCIELAAQVAEYAKRWQS